METKISVSAMQILLATCWCFIINMRCTGIKKKLFLFICSIADVFYFTFIFFPIEKSMLALKQNGLLIC